MTRCLTLSLFLLATGTSQAAEADYSLSCKREALSLERVTAKPTAAPFVARVHYTGGTSFLRNGNRSDVPSRLDDLVLSIRGRRIRGGSFFGSTYDASTSYDGDFSRTGNGLVTWGYSHAFNAFTLQQDGKTYVCDKQ